MGPTLKERAVAVLMEGSPTGRGSCPWDSEEVWIGRLGATTNATDGDRYGFRWVGALGWGGGAGLLRCACDLLI